MGDTTLREQLRATYDQYLLAVNHQNWDELSETVGQTITFNGKEYNFQGYRSLIPQGAHYSLVDQVIDVARRRVAVRLHKTIGAVHESEFCFYEFDSDLKIYQVCSMTTPTGTAAISYEGIKERYERYIDTLNKEDWSSFPKHLADTVNHNGNLLDHAGYRQLIPPQTHFTIVELLVDVAKRQVGVRLAITVGEKRVTEHVFYHFTEELKIDHVWSLVQDGEVTGQ